MNNKTDTNRTSNLTNENFINAKGVSELMGISVSRSYKIIQKLNMELESNGFITISGKVSRRYFMERVAL